MEVAEIDALPDLNARRGAVLLALTSTTHLREGASSSPARNYRRCGIGGLI